MLGMRSALKRKHKGARGEGRGWGGRLPMRRVGEEGKASFSGRHGTGAAGPDDGNEVTV